MLIGRLDSAMYQAGGPLHAVFHANAQLAASRGEEQLRSTALGAYLVMRLVARTLAEGETDGTALELQRISTTHFVDGLPTTLAECAHLRLLLTALMDDPDRGQLRHALWRYAGWLEREGRLDMALESLRLAARTWRGEIPPRDFTALALDVGRVNRQLARHDLAQDAYAAAAEGAAATGDRSAQLRARLGTISVHRLRGEMSGLDHALHALLQECELDQSLAALLPLVHADIGALFSSLGRPAEAVRAMLCAARAAATVPERLQILAGLGRILLEIGAGDIAQLLLQHVAAHASDRLLRGSAELELMELASLDGNRVGFERLRAALDRSLWRWPAAMQADFHYRSGLGFSRFAQLGRAGRSWAEGRAVADRHGLEEWTGFFRRVEGSLDGCRNVTIERHRPAGLRVDQLLEDVQALLAVGTARSTAPAANRP